jgi:hypothetical protein
MMGPGDCQHPLTQTRVSVLIHLRWFRSKERGKPRCRFRIIDYDMNPFLEDLQVVLDLFECKFSDQYGQD